MRRSLQKMLAKVPAVLVVVMVVMAGAYVGAQTDLPEGQIDLRALQSPTPESAEWNASAACTTSLCKECLYVDTYNATHPLGATAGSFWVTDIEHTSAILQAGSVYLVTVQGAVSLWAPNLWTDAGWYYFGVPGSIPAYPTPGITNGKTGWDFEYLFAYMSRSNLGNGITLPYDYAKQNVSIDGGITWFDPALIGGQSYRSSHVYQFVVEGKGKQMYVRFCDTGPTTDNYGRFYVCIQKLVPCVSATGISATAQ
jgi:hypothetical protein